MIEYKMTNNAAFNLGAFNYPCFCDSAIWVPNKEDFKYVYFFCWSNPHYNNSDWVFSGSLNEKVFETLEHKYYYVRGRLSAYSVTIESDGITVAYANSIRSRDRCVKWIKELLASNFNDSKWCIETTDGYNTVPYTPRFTLKADKEIINYFTAKNEIINTV